MFGAWLEDVWETTTNTEDLKFVIQLMYCYFYKLITMNCVYLTKASTTSRLDTASSQTSVNQEKYSVLDTSETLTLSMSNITPQTTPKVMEEEGKQEQRKMIIILLSINKVL